MKRVLTRRVSSEDAQAAPKDVREKYTSEDQNTTFLHECSKFELEICHKIQTWKKNNCFLLFTESKLANEKLNVSLRL